MSSTNPKYYTETRVRVRNVTTPPGTGPIALIATEAEGSVECIDVIKALLEAEDFVAHCKACALKYIWRAGRKGPESEDLAKAAQYLTWAATTAKDLECNGGDDKQ